MLKQLLVTLVLLLRFHVAFSQPEKILSNWSAKSPIEKAYLHFDRDDYMAGQTIWFKAYLYTDFLPADKSTSLYVEMLNTSSSVLNRQVFPVFGGFSRGQIELPDSLPEGAYIIRAYTATMLNHEPDFIYKKIFHITGKKVTGASVVIKPSAIRLEFFPEGGNLVTGLSNSVAFKASDPDGLPVAVSGAVKKENGETLTGFISYHDGMGYFDLVAEAGTRYHVVLNNDLSGQKYYLPEQTTKAVVLRVISSGKTRTYEILQRKDDPVFRAAYMIGQMQHHPVFRKDFKDNADEMTGMIQTDKLSSGILHITVFNKDGLPLAERLTFVDNKEYIQQGEINIDTLDFSERAKNRFTISLKDTVKGSFSVSITDPAFNLLPFRQQNIFSGLLLTSDLKGYVHNPAWYFSNAHADSIQNALDLVMMTNGWRRFKWEQLSKETDLALKYKDPAFVSLSGRVLLQGSAKSFANKDLMFYIVGADSSRSMQLVTTDINGYYNIDSLMFFGKASLFINILNNKKKQLIDVLPGGDSLHRVYSLIGINSFHPAKVRNNIVDDPFFNKLQQEYEFGTKNGGQILKEVIVTARVKTPLEMVEEKYASGLFSGYSQHTIDLVNSDEAVTYSNIFEYLELKIPGLQVIKPDYESEDKPKDKPGDMLKDYGPRYEIYYRQSFASVSALGPVPMTIYLDETITSTQAIAGIPANEIAMIKVFGNFVGATGGGPGGALAIYTKKNDANLKLSSSDKMISYNGFSILKEFYSPDYKVKSKVIKPDYRTTLYWNPTVFVNGIDPSFPVKFYNNDRTRQFKIVVEGMTADGKILLIEKLITAKKAF